MPFLPSRSIRQCHSFLSVWLDIVLHFFIWQDNVFILCLHGGAVPALSPLKSDSIILLHIKEDNVPLSFPWRNMGPILHSHLIRSFPLALDLSSLFLCVFDFRWDPLPGHPHTPQGHTHPARGRAAGLLISLWNPSQRFPTMFCPLTFNPMNKCS